MPVFNQSRSRIIRLIFAASFIVITAQLFYLQVVEDKYGAAARDNAVLEQIIWPERGIIYDRNGKSILENTVSFDLTITIGDTAGTNVHEFCRLMQMDTSEYYNRIKKALEKEKSKVKPIVFKGLIPEDQQARFKENKWKFPGFALAKRPVRTYKFNAAAHILGYIKEVDPKDIEKSGGFYHQGDYIGKTGLEAYYEKILMGQRGIALLMKDNKERVVGSYENGKYDTAAIAGRGLRTYIDIEMQVLAEQLMSNKVGGLVALDPRTGGILAMVSGPNFNPNDLTGSNAGKNFGKMQLDVTGPMLNRAIGGRYEPGSTFKPVGALVALNEGVITPSYGYPCGGRYTLCGHGKPACTHAGGGHAANLRLSIANSCNSYYAHVYRMTVDNPKYGGVKSGYLKWREYMNQFGLGVKLGVDIPGENTGFIPDTSVYNKENNNHWTSCTNLTLGIGQDKMQATPLQLANFTAIIANKGYYYTPHFVEKIDGETDEDTAFMNKFRKRHDILTHIPDTAYRAVIEGMADVVKFGTARVAQIPGVEVCAKTGTAETYTILDGRRIKLPNNSMFICFAPKDNPKIAVAVCVQNAGYGATWGGPIARILVEKFLNDTLMAKSKEDVKRISAANLMPAYFKRLQYREDSIRAIDWFQKTKDSSYLQPYISSLETEALPAVPALPSKPVAPGRKKDEHTDAAILVAVLPEQKYFRKPYALPAA
jgi:penicillin-binding protein 2